MLSNLHGYGKRTTAMSTDLTFITNESGKSLCDRFGVLLGDDTRLFDCLVGYFFISGFHRLHPALSKTEKIRILIGIKTDGATYELIQTAKEQQEFVLESHAQVRERVPGEILGELQKSGDSSDIEDGVRKFVEWIKSGKLEVRAYPSERVHAKLYIMTFQEGDRDKGRVITGSSNFTEAGLQNNLEFNVELKNRSDYDFALQKFNELWAKSVDVTKDYVTTIEVKSPFAQFTPYELYLKFLYEYFRGELNLPDEIEAMYLPTGFKKLKYQEEAVLNARKVLDEYGGAFLSDVVGLGKTYMSALLAQHLNEPCLVIAPPHLLDEHNPGSWPNVFRDFGVRGFLCESLGKLESLLDRDLQKFTTVFIDESHRFRTEDTQSYELLAQICRGKRVVLVSATPLNNTPQDILSQIKLFQPGKNSTIPNVRNLEAFFGKMQQKLKRLDRQHDREQYFKIVRENARETREKILKFLMIRRTRTEIDKYYGEDLKRQSLKFPEVANPEPLFYKFNKVENEVFNETIRSLEHDFKYARYLETELVGKVDKSAIETFISTGDRSADFEARPTQKHEDKRLPQSIREHAPLLDKKLQDIRVCDPAIGSGAFLVGMMHEIVRARLALSSVPDMPKRQPYELKRHVIQNCLFGVDIDPSAVEIAKLRLWLSLVVDENDLKQIKPLPNLDFKIMQGNSLLDEFEGVKLFDDRLLNLAGDASEAERQGVKQRIADLSAEYISLHQSAKLNPVRKLEINRDLEQQKKLLAALTSKSGESSQQAELSDRFSEARQKVEQLTKLHKDFFDVPSGKQKKELRQQLEKLEWEFMEATLKEQKKHEALEHLQKLRRASAKPFFLWKLQFMEVFREKGGFDVVIMNPPYGAEFTEAEKDLLKQKHENISERIRNSFLYFMGLGYEIVKKDGVACLILPNEFLFQIYMTKARRFFVTNTQVLFAVNTGEDVFEAVVPTCIIALKKHKLESHDIPVADLRKCELQELSRRLDVGSFTNSTSDIVLATPNSIFTFDLASTALVNKLAAKFTPFGDCCDDVANGISTSCDEIYIVTHKLVESETLEKNYLKQCIRGGQFTRFYCPPATKEYILYITDEFDPKAGKNIHRYLSANKALLVKKCVEKKEGSRQWNVLFRARYEGLFKKPKMLIRQTADRIVAAPDTEVGYYCIDSVNVALLKEAFVPQLNFLVGLLNSSLLNFYYREISQEGGRVLAQVKPQRIRSLPIPAVPSEQQKPVERLVERILSAKQRDAEADTSALEREIDELVYALYGLTPEEIKIVEEAKK